MMNFQDAAKILNLSGDITPTEVKRAYREACSKYHPDRNIGGEEMMKAANLAYEVLKDFSGTVAEDSQNYGDAMMIALNFATALTGVNIEVCGNWVWLDGDTKTHREALKETKQTFPDANGYRWAPKKKRWYFRPQDWTSKSRGQWDMDKIREEHGSTTYKGKANNRLAS